MIEQGTVVGLKTRLVPFTVSSKSGTVPVLRADKVIDVLSEMMDKIKVLETEICRLNLNLDLISSRCTDNK